MYKRILIKISGEALADDNGFGIGTTTINELVEQLKVLNKQGIQIGIVTTTDNNTYLNAHFRHLFYLLGVLLQTFDVDTVTLLAHKALATQLEQNTFKLCHIENILDNHYSFSKIGQILK